MDMMELHLFSSPGKDDDIRWIVEACRTHLEGKPDATVAYLPLASLSAEKWLEQTEKSFKGLARIETINTETMDLSEMEATLRRAALAYIPGGNTFLLNHRLHVSRLMLYLRKKIQAGLPVAAFSAGTVLCGPNILTSSDLNMVDTPHFDGLNVTPFNFHVHYADEVARDNWLIEYHVFHDHPVIMLEDGAYVKVAGKTTKLARGEAWIWRAGQEKERLKAGEQIAA
jgi:dipeptidase E